MMRRRSVARGMARTAATTAVVVGTATAPSSINSNRNMPASRPRSGRPKSQAFVELNLIVGQQQARGEANSEEMQLLKSIKQKSELLKINPTYGDKISQKLIPKTLSVSNLFRVELTGYWRMLYTLEGNRIEIVAFVLYLIDHPTYDKMFGYRKK